MSRDWEGEDDSDYWMLNYGRWEHGMKVAFKSKKGKKFLNEIKEALETMPVKKLIYGSLCEYRLNENEEPEVLSCAIGVYARYKGMNYNQLLDDPEDTWETVEIGQSFGMTQTLAWAIGYTNDSGDYKETDEERWQRVYNWVCKTLETGRFEYV